jgi:hypothetical protein
MRNKYELMFQSSYEEAEAHYDELIENHLKNLRELTDETIKSYNSGQQRRFRHHIGLVKLTAELIQQEINEFEEYKKTFK